MNIMREFELEYCENFIKGHVIRISYTYKTVIATYIDSGVDKKKWIADDQTSARAKYYWNEWNTDQVIAGNQTAEAGQLKKLKRWKRWY